MPQRCPNGSRRKPPKTGKCVKNNKKTTKKKCPKNKLLNPRTNRCINDNKLNRKKLGKISPIKSSSVQKIVTKACSMYDNLKTVDLSKVKYTGTTFGKFNLSFNSTPLTDIKYINEGTYGKVYLYGKGDIQIAVKTYKYPDDEEIDIIQMLNSKKISCNTVNTKLIRMPGEYISIMDIMSGSLDKMKGKLSLPDIYKTVKEIAKNLNCLDKKKLSYTDLKTANILFKCYDKKYIKTSLGDLGGICNRGADHIATWPPYEYKDDQGTVICNEKTMVWCLGVIILELLNLNVNRFHWSMIDGETSESINRYLDRVCMMKQLDTVKLKRKMTGDKLLLKMLDINSRKRIGLQTIINNI